jgi:uncharacterized protein YbaA (DUF1428 family)
MLETFQSNPYHHEPTSLCGRFLIPVPKDKIDAYKAVAQKASAIWKDHGALEYIECLADDLESNGMRSFIETAAAGPEDTVVFAYIVYPSREARDAVNQAVMADPRLKELCPESGGVIDCERMSYGGFKTIVKA